MSQFRKCQERAAWLHANPTHPDFAELDTRAARSGVHFGELRDELAEWAGCTAADVVGLIAVAVGETL